MPEISIELMRVGDPFRKPEFSVNERIKVTDLKDEIESFHDIPAEEQLLVYYSQVLDDNKTLQSYGIGEGSRIQLIIRSAGAMQISYQNGSKKGYVQVRPRDKIEQVKRIIAEKEGIDANRFHLKLGQTVLPDYATVVGSNIKWKSEVTCVT
ncbi:hypothetical protein FRC14_008025 [Serendipita sp. 396]|nr:hypothetical protein FRC14_008025 [Serendipita sp. 396]KAG8775752.1 hypothetical protein FRC15_000336 [Serendipita sp. 397]KAG8805307.1 hypothetical protein FRC18_006748 [Serendipita sp. 400]KAG8848271.1 hypothetical protein FRB91_010978 [Serendipita sp. 411]